MWVWLIKEFILVICTITTARFTSPFKSSSMSPSQVRNKLRETSLIALTSQLFVGGAKTYQHVLGANLLHVAACNAFKKPLENLGGQKWGRKIEPT